METPPKLGYTKTAPRIKTWRHSEHTIHVVEIHDLGHNDYDIVWDCITCGGGYPWTAAFPPADD